jgi:hypothetical protein
MYLVLDHLLSQLFFQLHLFTLCFYISFGPHSLNYDLFGLESFIELICFWISFFDILFLYKIWSSLFGLLFLVFILFLIEIVFQFHPLWFGFIFFLCQIWFFLLKSTFFKSLFFFNFFSSLSLIILVGLEFYIVIFLGLPFTLWSGLMICVINFEGWTGFTLVIFNYFKKFHPLSLSSLKIDFLCFFYGLDFFVNLIFLFDFVIQFNIFFYI